MLPSIMNMSFVLKTGPLIFLNAFNLNICQGVTEALYG